MLYVIRFIGITGLSKIDSQLFVISVLLAMWDFDADKKPHEADICLG